VLVIPAVDIREGKCVRLLQGRIDRETVYSEDPVQMARMWEEQGAPMLHLVDLDGAFTGIPKNLPVVKKIRGQVKVPLQLGGGVRSMEIIEKILSMDIDRVVLGTAAVSDSELVSRACSKFGERIVAAVDNKGGRVAVEGWESVADKDILEFDSVSGIYDTQLLVESDIIVPENEPDVLVLLALNPKTYINEVFVTEGKVQFEGKLALDILYLGEKNGELERIEKEIDYSHVIEDEGIDKRSRYMLVAKVENVDYKLVNSRKISVKAVIKIQCRLVVSNKKEVVIGAEDSIKIQALKKKVKLMHTVGQNSIEVFVKDKIKVPEGEAPIQKVIKTDVEVKPEEIKITDNKVIVQGSVLCNILYISQEGEFGNLAANLNYANFVDIPGALSYMSAKTQEEVIDVSTTVLEDEKGENTILDIEATIRVKVQVLETEERELPIDAYGTKGYIQPVRENLTVIEELQSYKSQFLNLDFSSFLP